MLAMLEQQQKQLQCIAFACLLSTTLNPLPFVMISLLYSNGNGSSINNSSSSKVGKHKNDSTSHNLSSHVRSTLTSFRLRRASNKL